MIIQVFGLMSVEKSVFVNLLLTANVYYRYLYHLTYTLLILLMFFSPHYIYVVAIVRNLVRYCNFYLGNVKYLNTPSTTVPSCSLFTVHIGDTLSLT